MSHELADPTAVIAVIARRVKTLRRRKDWTAAELGDALTVQGVPWDRFAVSSLENGKRRNVSVVELLALAVVLDVPPVFLLIPDGSDPLKVTEQIAMYALELLEWLTGTGFPPAATRTDPAAMQRWGQTAALLRLLPKFEHSSGPMAFPDEQTDVAVKRLADVVNQMIEGGIYPPPLPADWIAKMQAQGLRYPDRLTVAPAEGDDDGQG